MIEDIFEIRESSPEKGRGMFLKSEFEYIDGNNNTIPRSFIKGSELIIEDSPMVCIQNHENKDHGLVCVICNRYIGSLGLQWSVLTDDISLVDAIERLKKGDLGHFPSIPGYDDDKLSLKPYLDPILESHPLLAEFSITCSEGCARLQTVAYCLLKSDIPLFEKIITLCDDEAKNRFLFMFAVALSTTLGSAINLHKRFVAKRKEDPSLPQKSIGDCLDACWGHMDELVKKPYWEVCRTVHGPVPRLEDLETESCTSSAKALGNKMNFKWEQEMKDDASKLLDLLRQMIVSVLGEDEHLHENGTCCSHSNCCSNETSDTKGSSECCFASVCACGQDKIDTNETYGKIDQFDFSYIKNNLLMRRELREWVQLRVLRDESMVCMWLGAFCLNTIDVRIGNPIVSYLLTLKEGAEKKKRVSKDIKDALEEIEDGLRSIKNKWKKQKCLEGESNESDGDDEENCFKGINGSDSDFINFDFSRFFNGDDELKLNSDMIPSFHGFGLFPTISSINHDCNPNAMATYMHDNTVLLESRRRITGGEEISISYVDVSDDVYERQRGLFGYGFTCQCARCLKEEEEDGWSDDE